MEGKALHKYNSCCRVCLLNNNDEVGMSALFTTTYKSMNLFVMMSSCASLEIEERDALPSLICTKCLGRLIVAYDFQKQCQQTDRELRIELNIPLTTKCYENRIVEIDIKMPILTIAADIAIKNEEMPATNLPDEKLDENYGMHLSFDNTEENEVANNDPFDVTSKEELTSIRSLIVTTDKQKIEECLAIFVPSSGNEERPLKNPTARKDRKSFQCLVCKKQFNRSYSLQRHQSVHDDNGKPFECDECKIRFVSESSLIRHALRHENIFTEAVVKDNPPESFSYKCKFCEKTFDKSHKLSRHYITCHDEFKQHKCTVCEQKFALTSQLRGHLCGHKGERPFVCRVCDKGEKLMFIYFFFINLYYRFSTSICSYLSYENA